MTNKAQAVRDFIKASKERTPGEWYCPDTGDNDVFGGGYYITEGNVGTPNDEGNAAFIAAASRLDLDNLLDVVAKMGELCKLVTSPYSGDPEDPSWSDIQDLAHSLKALAQPYIDAVGE